jgi:gliding motility-associated-like protein
LKYPSFNYLLTLIFISVSTLSHAQYPSDNGQFEVNAREACVGATISITDPCTNCADYDFNNDRNGDGTNFIYNSPGSYTIEAYVAGGTVTDQVNVTIYPDTIPQVNIYRCGGRTVEVQINDDNYDSYRIEWGDGSQNEISGTDTEELHTYASPGTFTITVSGLYDMGDDTGNCTPNEQEVEIVDNIPTAEITAIYPLDNQPDKAVIKYNAPPHALYKLQLAINNSTTWIPSQDISPSEDSIIMENLQLDQSFYCFRIATLDACQSGNPSTAYSPALCTPDFDVEFTNNEENILTWRTSDINATGFTIDRGDIQPGPFDVSRRSYVDDEVLCNTDYCYTLITNYPSGATVRSLSKCGTANLITTPPAVEEMAIQVNDGQIALDWEKPPATTTVDHYNVFVSTNGSSYESAADDVTTSDFTDTGIAPSKERYCYQVNYEDRCENISTMSEEFCAIYLSGSISPRVIDINWNSYEGYNAGVSSYLVETYDENGSLINSSTTSGTSYSDTLDLSDPQVLRYKVTAIPNDGSLESSTSNVYVAIRKTVISVPNAFVPGSNGKNSIFNIISPFIREIDLRIFNRWGEMVYRTTDPDAGWPGIDQDGNRLPQGTYIYSAKIISESGEASEATGSVILLRR